MEGSTGYFDASFDLGCVRERPDDAGGHNEGVTPSGNTKRLLGHLVDDELADYEMVLEQ